jgi:hypothetical protein
MPAEEDTGGQQKMTTSVCRHSYYTKSDTNIYAGSLLPITLILSIYVSLPLV